MNSGSNGSHCGWTSRRKDSYWSCRPSFAIDKVSSKCWSWDTSTKEELIFLCISTTTSSWSTIGEARFSSTSRENGWSTNWARRLEAEVPRIWSSKGESNGRDWKFEEARRGNQCPSSPPVMPQQGVVLWLLAGLRRCCVFILLYMSLGTCFLTLFM